MIRNTPVFAAMIAMAVCVPAVAQTVEVEGRGPVDISRWFTCTDTPRSSIIRRVCYDRPKRYVLIKRNDTWHQHCEVGEPVVTHLLTADSVGAYYNRFIRGGPYDCRLHRPPLY
jgi:hypothetical protein